MSVKKETLFFKFNKIPHSLNTFSWNNKINRQFLKILKKVIIFTHPLLGFLSQRWFHNLIRHIYPHPKLPLEKGDIIIFRLIKTSFDKNKYSWLVLKKIKINQKQNYKKKGIVTPFSFLLQRGTNSLLWEKKQKKILVWNSNLKFFLTLNSSLE